MIEALLADNLKDAYGIRHGFFARCGGVSEGIYAGLNCNVSSADNPAHLIENRRLVALHLDVAPENLLSCHQVHSPDVVTVIEAWRTADRPHADAMVTRQRGLALGIQTADCVPVLFASERSGVIGAAHAGWRGALGGVIENTIAAMEKLGAERATIKAALGPCIAQNSYEVGPAFPAPFLAESPAHGKFFRPSLRPEHYHFDLPGYVMAKLRGLGIADIQPPLADTCADEARFFSYRRNCLAGADRSGGQLSVIMLIAPQSRPVTFDDIGREEEDTVREFMPWNGGL